MSFDKDTRNLLAKTVAACRRRLTEDVTDQLRGMFGLHPDGTVLPLDKLTHLSPDQHAAARRLRDLLDHYTTGAAGKDSDRRKAAYERMVLEISFTVLNRLAALRLCEERGLVVECVRKGTTSAGFQMFERISGGALGGRYDTYRVFLECLFDELALDLGVLFDRMTPQSAVFPTERCMEDVLAELNKPELTHLWTEDETIGWIYQYFNPPEERKAMREASQAPRNSRELAVRNQFFTPRYVVEFLTDNTLGRIWFEMRKGDTALKEECRYLVRRPNEVFLGPGEKAPADQSDGTDISQEELLKQSVYIEHRPKKDPRDLHILDPADGSGHFLLYAFDLLEHIYEEAWADPESPKSKVTGRTLREDYETLDDLRRAGPKLIIEHNLHGIDIDPRAVQIAALALWLRAQKTWKDLGIKGADRPRIARSNLVTAEPMPGEEDMRREFTAGLKPRVLGQIVDEVFKKMKLAGEAGSLLKIEEEIKDAVAQARKQWLEGPKPEQQFLFPGMAVRRPEQQELRFDVKGITDERFWEQAEDRILDALKGYAQQAENGRAARRRLFADDAARGFAFIDLCRKRYDVVLMNPPFGSATIHTEHFTKQLDAICANLFSGFVIRGVGLLTPGGLLGAITDRSFVVKETYKDYREWLYDRSSPRVFIDLGWDVLDANVEVCAYTVGERKESTSGLFCNFASVAPVVIGDEIAGNIERLGFGEPTFVHVSFKAFRNLPHDSMSYWLPTTLLNDFTSGDMLDVTGGKPARGMSSGNTAFACRLVWEVPQQLIGKKRRWNPVNVGGGKAAFYRAPFMVFHYIENWGCMREFPGFSLKNTDLFWRPAIGWGKRTDILSTQLLPEGMITAEDGQVFVPHFLENIWILLGFLNSRYAQAAIHSICGGHKGPGYLGKIPFRRVLITRYELGSLARRGYDLKRDLSRIDETTGGFGSPFAFASGIGWTKETTQQLASLVCQVSGVLRRIDRTVYGSLKKTEEEIAKIERTLPGMLEVEVGWPSDRRDLFEAALSYSIGSLLGRWDVRVAIDSSLTPKLPDPFDPLPVCPPGMLVGPDGLPAEPNRIVSEEWLRARPDANTLPPDGSVKNPTISDSEYPIRISWDGVLVDDPGFNGDRPHRDDIVRRVREVFDLLWKDKAHEIEQEACDILGVSDLRHYFRRPAGFFQDHLKRYSKSRRKAPIYWPLSTASGSYTIWLYYHRLTDQILYVAINKYVEPKIAEVQRAVDSYQGSVETREKGQPDAQHPDYRSLTTSQLRERWEEARAFLGELRDLREELLRIAALPFKPDLNDGVIINAAPFHQLVRLRSWAIDTGDCWKKLCEGEYDWAHLAYTTWPDRVRGVCKRDRSIAIAHGLEHLFEAKSAASKKKGGRKIKLEETEEDQT